MLFRANLVTICAIWNDTIFPKLKFKNEVAQLFRNHPSVGGWKTGILFRYDNEAWVCWHVSRRVLPQPTAPWDDPNVKVINDALYINRNLPTPIWESTKNLPRYSIEFVRCELGVLIAQEIGVNSVKTASRIASDSSLVICLPSGLQSLTGASCFLEKMSLNRNGAAAFAVFNMPEN